MSQPTRPRPRPRLVSKQTTSSDKPDAVVDEDDHFRRNRGRTAQHWRQLNESDAKAIPFTASDDDWDLADTHDQLSNFRKKKKKRPIKNDIPRWQGTDAARILSSDDEFEDDEVQIIEPTPLGNRSPGKRKRERSRSKSITPPPELPPHQRANAINLVRQALGVQPRSPSPNFFLDDSNDTIDLDPELAKIAETVRQQVKCASTSTNPEHAGGPETVNIKVRWRPHPLNTSAQEQSWSFKMKRHDTFRELFDAVADLAGVMTDQLVINHDQRRVFASGTPHSLHIWAAGELEACDKHTAEYIRTQRSNVRLSPRSPTTPISPPTAPQSDADSEAESTGEDTIKLILRSAATKDKTFPLTVRSTATCGAIVKAFLKAAGLPDDYSLVARTNGIGKSPTPFPQVVIDGDKMEYEAEIGDADLENGDLVEIVGI